MSKSRKTVSRRFTCVWFVSVRLVKQKLWAEPNRAIDSKEKPSRSNKNRFFVVFSLGWFDLQFSIGLVRFCNGKYLCSYLKLISCSKSVTSDIVAKLNGLLLHKTT